MTPDDRALNQAERAPRMESGTITSMTPAGFGFISADRHSGEVWIRPRSTEEKADLQVGQRVEYVLAAGPLGVEAARVRPSQPEQPG
jgi:cold shock CspA family protein